MTTLGHTVLALPMPQPNDAAAATVRDYLVALLQALWTEGEGFGGKEPSGNSDWTDQLITPLVAAGIVHGIIDGDGRLVEYDARTAQAVMAGAIAALGSA